MKLLTITVPCFNSESYMHHCIDSLLVGGEDIEILIVDDGSIGSLFFHLYFVACVTTQSHHLLTIDHIFRAAQ